MCRISLPNGVSSFISRRNKNESNHFSVKGSILIDFLKGIDKDIYSLVSELIASANSHKERFLFKGSSCNLLGYFLELSGSSFVFFKEASTIAYMTFVKAIRSNHLRDTA